MMKHLRYSSQGAPHGKEYLHPEDNMEKLGITYQHSVPQSMMDCWWFFNCEGNTENLPSYISEMANFPFSKAIGYGLSKEDAKSIKHYKRKRIKP